VPQKNVNTVYIACNLDDCKIFIFPRDESREEKMFKVFNIFCETTQINKANQSQFGCTIILSNHCHHSLARRLWSKIKIKM